MTLKFIILNLNFKLKVQWELLELNGNCDSNLKNEIDIDERSPRLWNETQIWYVHQCFWIFNRYSFIRNLHPYFYLVTLYIGFSCQLSWWATTAKKIKCLWCCRPISIQIKGDLLFIALKCTWVLTRLFEFWLSIISFIHSFESVLSSKSIVFGSRIEHVFFLLFLRWTPVTTSISIRFERKKHGRN
jgi:hypothetical protein